MFNKYLGSIIGGCVGDALGFPIEGHDRSLIENYIKLIDNGEVLNISRGFNNKTKFNGPIMPNDLKNCDWFYKFGQYTDDSQLSREVLISILENNGKFDYSDYGKRIGEIFKPTEKFPHGKIVGYGISTKTAAQKLRNNIYYQFSGTTNTSSNGSAMRSDIFGILFNNNRDKLIEVTSKQSMMTHMSSVCAAGSVCIATFVAMALNNKEIDTNKFIETAYDCTHKIDLEYSENLLKMKKIYKLSFDEAFKIIRAMEDNPWPGHKISCNVTSSTLWSIYSFLKYPNNYMKCIKNALRVGGDVDTMAKMAGSISGAFLGIGAIPLEFVKKINDKGTWDCNDFYKSIEKMTKLIENKKIST